MRAGKRFEQLTADQSVVELLVAWANITSFISAIGLLVKSSWTRAGIRRSPDFMSAVSRS
jgi:hypothetical protein